MPATVMTGTKSPSTERDAASHDATPSTPSFENTASFESSSLKSTASRTISRTSFVLKGGGWYSDLYSSAGAKDDKAAKPDSGDAKAASNATDSKSESKKDSKKDSKSADAPKTKDKPSAKSKGKGKGSKAVA